MSKRSGIMLAYPFEERRLTNPKFLWKFPVIVQPKLDGERCRAVPSPEGFILLSSECNEITMLPHISEYLNSLFRNLPPMELDGELYKHGWNFSDIHSVVSRRENIHERAELMQFHIFDFVSSDQQLIRTDQLTGLQGLNNGPLKLVSSRIAWNMSDIMELYKNFIDLGYEGIIVRHIRAPYVRKRSRFMLKFKPKKDDYYKIVEIIEAISEQSVPLNMVGAFKCCGSDGTLFKIGAGKLTHQQRKDLWKDNLVDKFCHVQYQNITSGGVPRFGLCLEIADKNPEEASGGGIL